MRRVRLRRRVYRVANALRIVFGEGVAIKTIGLGAYIVSYRHRKIAFTSEGRLIAIGCNPHPDKYSQNWDQRVSADIYEKVVEVEKLLHNDSAGRIILL